jgi:hypothetical protein
MPCRDYESDTQSDTIARLQERNDKLARIACRAMQELEDNGIGEFLLLKDTEAREWWMAHKKADAAEAARKKAAREAAAEKKRLQALKKEVIARLSADERKALSIK